MITLNELTTTSSFLVHFVAFLLHELIQSKYQPPQRREEGCERLTISMQSPVPLGPGKFHVVFSFILKLVTFSPPSKPSMLKLPSVRNTGLTVYDSLELGSVVRIKRVNFRENIWVFRQDQQNCSLYTGVRRAGFHCILHLGKFKIIDNATGAV